MQSILSLAIHNWRKTDHFLLYINSLPSVFSRFVIRFHSFSSVFTRFPSVSMCFHPFFHPFSCVSIRLHPFSPDSRFSNNAIRKQNTTYKKTNLGVEKFGEKYELRAKSFLGEKIPFGRKIRSRSKIQFGRKIWFGSKIHNLAVNTIWE